MKAEFSRLLPLGEVGAGIVRRIEASASELAMLAERFDLRALESLVAGYDIVPVPGGIRVSGTVSGTATQVCVVSDDDVAASVEDSVDLLLLRGAGFGAEEVELDAGACDVLPLEGDSIDLGEITAQSFGLALDPYPRAPAERLEAARKKLLSEEEAARRAAAERAASTPFAMLKRRD